MLIMKTALVTLITAITLASQNSSTEQSKLAGIKVGQIYADNEEQRVSPPPDNKGPERRINVNLSDKDTIYLTDPETGERVEEVNADGEYLLHIYVVNDGELDGDVGDVRVIVGQGDDYDSVRLNLLIRYVDLTPEACAVSRHVTAWYSVSNRDTCDAWLRFRPVGKAKLYNKGLLNGAQVNHKQLFASTDISSGIYVGFDDQNGVLPHGEKYACEIRVPVKLEPTEAWNHFWSDIKEPPTDDPGISQNDWFAERCDGQTINEMIPEEDAE